MKVFKIIFHLIFTGILISACSTGGLVSSHRFPAYSIGSGENVQTDSATESIIRPYRIPLDEKMNEVVAHCLQPATRNLPESSLGNLVCDLLMEETAFTAGIRADVCLMNTGGLRINLPGGKITRSMIFELMPFENELVLAEITGGNLRQILDQVADRGGGPVSGIRMKISNGKARDIIIGDSLLEETHIYRLLSSDYILNGGDRFVIPALISMQPLQIKVREALLHCMSRAYSAGGTINPRTDGRIISE